MKCLKNGAYHGSPLHAEAPEAYRSYRIPPRITGMLLGLFLS